MAHQERLREGDLAARREDPASLAGESIGCRELTRDIKVCVEHGIHARPAALIVKLTGFFFGKDSADTATLTSGGETVKALSQMGVLMLAAGPGSVLRVCVRGADPERAAHYLDNFERLMREPRPEVDIFDDRKVAAMGLHPCELVACLRARA